MTVAASGSGRSLSSGAGTLSFKLDVATDLYRISSGGALLTESGDRAVPAKADGSASQLWRVSACEGGYAIASESGPALVAHSAKKTEGSEVWLYQPNGTPALR